MKSRNLAAALAALPAVVAAPAYAAGTPATLDFSSFTDQVDITTTMAAIMLVGGTLFLLHLAILGISKMRRVAK